MKQLQLYYSFTHFSSVVVSWRYNFPQTKWVHNSFCCRSPRIPIVKGCSFLSKRHLFDLFVCRHNAHIPSSSKKQSRRERGEAERFTEKGGTGERKRRKNHVPHGRRRNETPNIRLSQIRVEINRIHAQPEWPSAPCTDPCPTCLLFHLCMFLCTQNKRPRAPRVHSSTLLTPEQ